MAGLQKYKCLQTRCSRGCFTNRFISDWLIDWFGHHFPPDIHIIINPKPIKLESWNFERMFTPHHVSCVTCHMSCVTCQMSQLIFFKISCRNFWYKTKEKKEKKKKKKLILQKNGKSIGVSLWRVCYEWGLPCLVLIMDDFWIFGNFPIISDF